MLYMRHVVCFPWVLRTTSAPPNWCVLKSLHQFSSISAIVEPPPQESKTEHVPNAAKPLSSNVAESDAGDGGEGTGTASSDDRWAGLGEGGGLRFVVDKGAFFTIVFGCSLKFVWIWLSLTTVTSSGNYQSKLSLFMRMRIFPRYSAVSCFLKYVFEVFFLQLLNPSCKANPCVFWIVMRKIQNLETVQWWSRTRLSPLPNR